MTNQSTEHEFPCRVMPTRRCPLIYKGQCGTRPCARFESDDETLWIPEIRPPNFRGEYEELLKQPKGLNQKPKWPIIDSGPEIFETADVVNQLIKAMIIEQYRLVETEFEKAIQGGLYGVKVVRYANGVIKSVSVDPEVPYGVIHEHQTQEWW